MVMGALIPTASGTGTERQESSVEGMIFIEDFPDAVRIQNGVMEHVIGIDYGIEDLIRDNRHYSRIVLKDGAMTTGSQGEERPFVTAILSVPGEVSDIDVSFGSPDRAASRPTPALAPVYIGYDGDPIDERWKGGISENVDTGFEIIRISGTPDNEGGKIQYSLRLYPVEHRVDGDTMIYRKVRIRMEVKSVSMDYKIMDYSRKPTGPIKYLIITDESLVEAVKPLAEWKSQKGLFSKIATTEEIDEMYDKGDLPGKMRQLVMDIEAADDLDYLLLAGDWDRVPSRNTSNNQPATMYGEPGYFASDIYFACVDRGTTWNKNGNTKYAEPGEIDDPVPDMSFGRLAINDPSTLAEVVDALIEREINLTWEKDYNTAVYMAGDNQNVPGESTEVMDHFWTEYGSDNFPGRETIYYDGSGTMNYGSGSFLEIINDKHQVLGYFSHGQATAIPNLVTREDLTGLKGNGYAGSFFAMACMTGWFDKPGSGMMGFSGDCIGEALTERPGEGVVAYMGANRLAAGNSDTVYSGDAPGLEEDYYRSVDKAVKGEIEPTVGNIYRNSVTSFVSSFYPFPNNQMDVSERTFLEYNLFGEPDAPLILGEVGELSLFHALSDDKRSVYAEVTDSNGDPVEGAVVTISRYGELGRSSLTDSNGMASINIPDSNGGLITITAYMSGYKPDFSTFILPDTLAPEAVYSVDPEEPDGRNGIYLATPQITLGADEVVTVEYRWDGGTLDTGGDGTTLESMEGFHVLSFRAIDLSGHASDWVEITIEVDSTPPGIEIVVDPSQPDGLNGYYISEPRLSMKTSEEIEEAFYSMDSGSDIPYLDPITVPEGGHEVAFTAFDMAGNINMTSIYLVVDSTPPMTRLSTSHEPDGRNGIYISPPEIELENMLSEEAEIFYRWDEDDWAPYTTSLAAPEGKHLLSYKSMDSAGNTEVIISREFIVDSIAPEMSILISPFSPDGKNGFYTSIPEITMTAQDGSIEYLLLEEGSEADWSEAVDYREEINVPDGKWILLARVMDQAGNLLHTDPIDLAVDTALPMISSEVKPEEPTGKNGWYVSDPYLSIETNENDLNVYYRMDINDEWIPYTESVIIGNGVHDPEVMAEDQAGNTIYLSLGTVKVDRDNPCINSMEPSNGTVTGKYDLRVTWNASDPTSDIAEIKVKLDDGSWIRASEPYGITLGVLDDGYHMVGIMMEDSAGNIITESRHFKVDGAAPYVIAFSPQGSDLPDDSAVTVQFSEDMDRESVSVLVNGDPALIEWGGASALIHPGGGLQNGGEYQVVIEGSDLYGNRMQPHIWSFGIIDAPEEIDQDADSGGMYNLPILIGSVSAVFILLMLSTAAAVAVLRRIGSK
ncbi:MAG: C25 family cysteine peptidase [Thermoplasmatota archaeon]